MVGDEGVGHRVRVRVRIRVTNLLVTTKRERVVLGGEAVGDGGGGSHGRGAGLTATRDGAACSGLGGADRGALLGVEDRGGAHRGELLDEARVVGEGPELEGWREGRRIESWGGTYVR